MRRQSLILVSARAGSRCDMTEIRIMTVRQPWAYAIFYQGKDVENRSRNIAGSYRGPVLVQAAMQHDIHAPHEIQKRFDDATDLGGMLWTRQQYGFIIGVVDLVDVHKTSEGIAAGFGLCSRWAETDMWHLQLESPRLLPSPVPYRGKLGLTRFWNKCMACAGEGHVNLHDRRNGISCPTCVGTGAQIYGLEALL